MIIIVLISVLLFESCSRNRRLLNEVEKIDLDISINRFEQDLFHLDIYNLENEIPTLYEKYGEYFSVYTNRVISVGDSSRPDFEKGLKSFITDQTIYEVYKLVNQRYASFEDIQSKLTRAFKFYKYYFNQKEVPKIYTHISGFNQSIFTTDRILSISLDKYLGENEPIYDRLYPPLPKYQRFIMHAGKIPSDVIKAWVLTEYEYKPEKDNLLSRMIHEGRAMYIIKLLLPEEPDSLIWGYTEDQLRFCITNEEAMWIFLVENKLLFETERFTVEKYVGEAPFTKAFGKESPGKAAIWIGSRIVKSYVEKNGISLTQLVSESDYQRILNLSGYNP